MKNPLHRNMTLIFEELAGNTTSTSARRPHSDAGNNFKRTSWPDTESNTVLVVDDDDAVRRLVSAFLHAEGFQVIEAGNGAAALAALRRLGTSIRVVVSAVVMEPVDGVSLFESVSEEFVHLPFVFITAYADNERMISVPTRYPVITKPFAPQALLTCIRHVLALGANQPPRFHYDDRSYVSCPDSHQ